jgi:hypothetical protein
MKVDIPYEVADQLIVVGLKEQLECLKDFLAKNKETEECARVFETDRLEDRRLIKKHIKAFKRVLTWYGGTDETK